MEGKRENLLNLDAIDYSYFIKSSSVERKDGLYLDDETISILNELTDDRNPFDIGLPFDQSNLSGSKVIRAGVKLIKENPELLIMIHNEIGVDNL